MYKWLILSLCLSFFFTGISPAFTQENGDIPTTTIVVKGIAISDFNSHFWVHNRFNTGTCLVREGDYIWAVAQTDDYIGLYTSSIDCEGIGWISKRALEGEVEWEDGPTLHALEEVNLREPYYFLDYGAFCDAVDENPTYGDAPSIPYPYQIITKLGGLDPDRYPAPILATTEDEIDVVVCLTHDSHRVTTCDYADSQGTQVTIARIQLSTRVRMVDYATGEIFAEQWLNGASPPACPDTKVGTSDIIGDYPEIDRWITANAYGVTSQVTRTVVNATSITGRNLPNTEADMLTQLSSETPVSLIARNQAADWVVGLLPDGTQAWLYVSLLDVAMSTDVTSLPIAEGPAAEVPFPLP